MERKEITAFLINCQPDEFMAYVDQGDQGTVVVGPDGKKYRFSNDQLDQAVIEIKRKHVPEAIPGAAAAVPVKKRAPAKQAASTTKKKPAKKSKPVPKPVHGRTDRGTV